MACALSEDVYDEIIFIRNQFCKLCEQRLVSPQVLSCLHAVCEHCLMYLLYTAQGTSSEDYCIVCPDCKKAVTVGSVASNLMTPQSTFTLFDCSTCVKETNSVFRCEYCSKFFCLSCFREHSYVSCVSVIGSKRLQKCLEHNMDLKHFCVKCEQAACVFCLTTKHNGDDHKHISIFEAVKDVRDNVEKLLDNAKDHTNQCYGNISCLHEILTSLRSKKYSSKDELEATFQSYVTLFEKYYNDATNHINAIYSEEEMKVKKLMKEFEGFRAQIGESSKMAKKVLMEADITALVKFRASIPAFSEPSIPLQDEVKALLDGYASKAVDKTIQSVFNDFHEKMILTNEGLLASFSSKSHENPKKPIDESMSASTSKSVLSESNLPIEGGRLPMPFQNYKPLTIKLTFGGVGAHDGQFNNPSGFCIGANDEIIVVDSYNHRVQIFDKNGTFKLSFGVPGKLEGNLWFPSKIAIIGKNDRFVISDQGIERSRFQVFSFTGNFIRKINFFDVAVPSALVVTKEGYIIIVDKQVRFVYMIKESGELIRCFSCSNYIVEPSDIAVYDCELFICDFRAHCVAVFTTAGVFRRYIEDRGVCSYPSGIYVTKKDVLVCDSNNTRLHVSRFKRNGQLKDSYICIDMKLSRCCGIRLNSEGDIVTVSRSFHTVLIAKNPFIE